MEYACSRRKERSRKEGGRGDKARDLKIEKDSKRVSILFLSTVGKNATISFNRY